MQTLKSRARNTARTRRRRGTDESPLIPLANVSAWLRKIITKRTSWSLQSCRLHRVFPTRTADAHFELILTLRTPDESVDLPLQGGWSGLSTSDRQHRVPTIASRRLSGLRLQNRRLGIWLCTPELDPRIAWSAELFDPGQVRRLLSNITSEPLSRNGRSAEPPEITLVAYRAHRRCTVKVQTGDVGSQAVFYIKAFRRLPRIYHGRTLERLNAMAERREANAFTFSTPARVDRTRRLVVMPAADRTARAFEYTLPSVRGVARGLACLHDMPIGPRLHRHTHRDEWATVGRWLPVLARAVDRARVTFFQHLVDRLSHAVENVPPPASRWIHRDFYHAQILTVSRRFWIVDADTMCYGAPEQDVANFLGHQFLEELLDRAPCRPQRALPRAFVEAYREAGGTVDGKTFAFYLACSLTRLGAIHWVRGVGVAAIDRLWTAAAEILDDPRDIDAALESLVVGARGLRQKKSAEVRAT